MTSRPDTTTAALGDKPPRAVGVTYSGREAARRAGITYRMLDYWLREGKIDTDCEREPGSGRSRHLSELDVSVLRVLGNLSDMHVSNTPSGHQMRLFQHVVREIRYNTTILRDPHIYISFDGAIVTTLVSAWESDDLGPGWVVSTHREPLQ